MAGGLENYVIRGGAQGKARLAVLARVMAPATRALLDQIGPLPGQSVVDAGCGGGEISFELADRVGPTGRVVGLDLDEEKLALARAEAADRGYSNIDFRCAGVLEPWPVDGADLVWMRFLLTHLSAPETALAYARAALAPGGRIAAQDIDYRGRFCDPPSTAHDRYVELYVAASRHRGGDPWIGARLPRLLEEAGFGDVDATIAQPFGKSDDIKAIALLTLSGIAATLVETGLATEGEIDQLTADLAAFAGRPDTRMAVPRIVQAWGRRP